MGRIVSQCGSVYSEGKTMEMFKREINVLSWMDARGRVFCLEEVSTVLDEVMYFDDRVG